MKKYLFVLIALAFMACEETIFVGGTVTDYRTGDSIVGIEIGLYMAKTDFEYLNKKWSELELLATSVSDENGFVSMEIDKDTDMSSNVFYYPVPTVDTLSINAQYTADYALESSFNSQYGNNGIFRFYRSSNIQIKLINFVQDEIKVKYADRVVSIGSRTYTTMLNYIRPFTGQTCRFELFTMDDEYLGSVNPYLKTQLPEDPDQVEWRMPLQIIEIDYNTLEK